MPQFDIRRRLGISSRGFGSGPRRTPRRRGVIVAARANRIAVATGPGGAPAARILAFRNLVWSVEAIQPPPVSTSARTGLFIG